MFKVVAHLPLAIAGDALLLPESADNALFLPAIAGRENAGEALLYLEINGKSLFCCCTVG